MSNIEVFNMYFRIIEDSRYEINIIHSLINILNLVMMKIALINSLSIAKIDVHY